MTKRIRIKDRYIGGGAEITVQSMTNTKTEDVKATVAQILRLQRAGCDIVRMSVNTPEAADAVAEIKKQVDLPLVADIHFDHKLALRAIENGIDKIRINPSNIG
ncbi:MAG TPA: 4-hydroxy-3-methylbut-2-en-1-yl diphosphate synthase, partial [Clostridiales bacterium]|nr:4-hydroxy-3-methylbut-2-en-1-yl diphosphate synthase [Clostridiales bacterium]